MILVGKLAVLTPSVKWSITSRCAHVLQDLLAPLRFNVTYHLNVSLNYDVNDEFYL